MESLAAGPGSPAREGARRRALEVLFSAVANAALVGALGTLGALAGCGGGGGGAPVPPPSPPPVPTPSPTPTAPIAAQLTVPTPIGYDTDRLAAFNRLNEIRLAAGLGMVAQSTAMDQAAQAHALWMIANDSFTHEEVEGTMGFTGINWARRVEAFGYVPVSGYEVMSAGGSGAASVDALVNMAYHRAAILSFEPVDVGVGWSGKVANDLSKPLVVDLTRPGTDTVRGVGQAAQAGIHGIEVWPVDGAHGVPVRMGLEIPNPVPGQDVSTLGTPASISVDESKTISAVAFVMTSSSTGAAVPVYVLTALNDPNSLAPGSYVAAIPLIVLAPDTTYEVAFSGSTVEYPSGARATIDRRWSFTTAAQ